MDVNKSNHYVITAVIFGDSPVMSLLWLHWRRPWRCLKKSSSRQKTFKEEEKIYAICPCTSISCLSCTGGVGKGGSNKCNILIYIHTLNKNKQREWSFARSTASLLLQRGGCETDGWLVTWVSGQSAVGHSGPGDKGQVKRREERNVVGGEKSWRFPYTRLIK